MPFYFICALIFLAAFSYMHSAIWAQPTNKADVSLLAHCLPSTELVVASQISVEFDLGKDRTGMGLPIATATVTGGPSDFKSSGRIAAVKWVPNTDSAVAFIEGPRSHYWAPCSAEMMPSDMVLLVAHVASGNPYSSIYFRQGMDKSGQLANFSQTPQSAENPVVVAKASMDGNTAMALFGEGTSAPYTIAATMRLSTEMNMIANTQIILGVINE